MSKNENEAAKALQIHIQKLQKQKENLDQKFKYPHSEEFRQEFINLSREYVSLDKLKQIETIKNPQKKIKSPRRFRKKRQISKEKVSRNESFI